MGETIGPDANLSESLGSPPSIPSPRIPNIAGTPPRTLNAAGSGNSQLYRELRYRLKQANKTMGRQGQTIANLRGELARIREEHSKIERGELRRLERFEAESLVSLARAHAEVGRLREKLEGDTVTALLGEANAEAERLREELAKVKGHVVTGQHAVDRAAAELEAQA